MRIAKQISPQTTKIYKYELDKCLKCDSSLKQSDNLSGRKVVQTMTGVLQIGYYAKKCVITECGEWLRSGEWQQIAPMYGTYGYDVIATIGWQRQTGHRTFGEIHQEIAKKVQISEAQVRYLYNEQYLPLLACHERASWPELIRVSAEQGLILTLDGLAPEGGEPQLWLVRELRTGKTLRSGWLSEQGQVAFENLLRPIAEAGLRVEAVLSDKQVGLSPAIATVLPQAKHAYCQAHYLKNIAQPIATADEAMKVRLRQEVRANIGQLIRPEQVEKQGVLMFTGLLPSQIPDQEAKFQPRPEPTEPLSQAEVEKSEAHSSTPTSKPVTAPSVGAEQAEIETALKRRIRYLLTLKGRPPFGLAGLEMYTGLNEVSAHLTEMITHLASPCLIQLQSGLTQALTKFQPEYLDLSQGATWLHRIAELLAPDGQPARSGAQVQVDLVDYLQEIQAQAQGNQLLSNFASQINKTSQNYLPGLFHTYDLPDLPRTNNDREREFRELNQHLLRTTGQKGTTRRLIQRSGAWELIPRPNSLAETIAAISAVTHDQYKKERTRIRSHRKRFQFHTRSSKLSQKQLHLLKQRWLQLPPDISFTLPQRE